MNNKSIILIIIWVIAISSSVHTQDNDYLYEPVEAEMDSLMRAFHETGNDSLKVELSRKIAFYYHEKNTNTALYYHNIQLELARKLGFKIWEADALELSGFMAQHLGHYPQALQYFQQASRIVEEPACERDTYRPEVLSIRGTPEAARLTVMALIHIDMLMVYQATANHEKYLASLKRGIQIAHEIGDYAILSFGYGSLGDVSYQKNQLDSAMYYYQKALLYADTAKYHKYDGSILLSIGGIYTKLGDLNIARKYYNKSAEISLETGNIRAIGDTYLGMADFFLDQNLPDSSIIFTMKGLALSREVNFRRNMLRSFRLLAGVYAGLGNMDSAYYYQSKANTTSDSMLSEEKLVHIQNLYFSEQVRLDELEEEKEKYQNKVRIRALISGLVLILVVTGLLYRNNRSRRKSLKLVQRQRNDLQTALSELKTTQAQLVHSEKMASLGELTAGIAHEIQNPLNFVNNFSEVSGDLVDEMNEEINDGNINEVKAISADLKENLEKISHHGHRASSIVKGMLEHSRSGDGKKELTNINELADEYLRLAFHGLRAKDKTFNANFRTDFAEDMPIAHVVPQDIGRVLLNLINNAFHAVSARSKKESEGYSPTVIVCTKILDDKLFVGVKDNGGGIPAELEKKIFQPFFTTKASGEGTGLGLSLAFDIIKKGHEGELKLENHIGDGAEFIITIPIEINRKNKY